MKYIIDKNTTKLILYPYKDDFNYLLNQEMTFDTEYKCLEGGLVYSGAKYLKIESKIFNNTEAVFASNQITLILVMSILAHQLNSDAKNEEFNQNLKQFYKYIGNCILKQQLFVFNKMITQDDDFIPFKACVKATRKTNNGQYYLINISIGKESNFEVIFKGFMLPTDPHDLSSSKIN